MRPPLARRIVAEFVATALLLAAVVGSGIMGERLAGGNVAIALLANTIATGAALIALILAFGPISGAHLNPAVTLADALLGGIPWRETPAYIAAQLAGAFAGVAAAHLMFGAPIFSLSLHARSGPAQAFSEFVATFGLLSVIWGCSRAGTGTHAGAPHLAEMWDRTGTDAGAPHREEMWERTGTDAGAPSKLRLGGMEETSPKGANSPFTPFAVGAYITAAYWFTASTSFANPAVTLARALTNTFSGIRPADVPAFTAAQLAGALAATLLFRWLLREPRHS